MSFWTAIRDALFGKPTPPPGPFAIPAAPLDPEAPLISTPPVKVDAPIDRFPACFSFTVSEEGVTLSLDPNDPGNWTGGAVNKGELRGSTYGISAESYPTLDIANLTRDQAAAIYRPDYFDAAHCGDLPAGVDLVVFDFAVNAGVRRSIETLQTAVLVKADGNIGPVTLAAVALIPPATLVVTLTRAREVFYNAAKDSARYAKEWDGRAERCLLAAQALIRAG